MGHNHYSQVEELYASKKVEYQSSIIKEKPSRTIEEDLYEN